MRRIATLAAAAFGLLVPAPASAITLTNHVEIPHGVTHEAEEHVVVTTTVPPGDDDDDGCRNSLDSYSGPGCEAPPPPPEPEPVEAVGVEPTLATPAEPAIDPSPPSSGCPSYMAGEASSPTDINASSGAAGCYQVIPSTADAMGAACTDVNAPSCLAAICAAQGNDAWDAANPC